MKRFFIGQIMSVPAGKPQSGNAYFNLPRIAYIAHATAPPVKLAPAPAASNAAIPLFKLINPPLILNTSVYISPAKIKSPPSIYAGINLSFTLFTMKQKNNWTAKNTAAIIANISIVLVSTKFNLTLYNFPKRKWH